MIVFKITNIFFITSLLLLLPLVEPMSDNINSISLAPNTIKKVTYNVHTTSVVVDVLGDKAVIINIFKFDIDTEKLYQTHFNIEITKTSKVDFSDPGLYLFSLISTTTNAVEFHGEGIIKSHQFIVLVLLIINVTVFGYYKYKQRSEI